MSEIFMNESEVSKDFERWWANGLGHCEMFTDADKKIADAAFVAGFAMGLKRSREMFARLNGEPT